MDIAESFQKETASLQSSFSEHIECEKVSLSCTSEGLMRDLKHQLEEKELLLEDLHQEVKCMRKARDDAICSNDELIASHQAEQQASRPLFYSLCYSCEIITAKWIDVSTYLSENYTRTCQEQSQQPDA